MASAEDSDVALVVAITRGNRDALAEVYRRHGDQAYGLAQRLCGGAQAEEVVQQVFVEMWETPDGYDPDRGSLRTFLLTEVHRRSVDRLRTGGPRPSALPDGQRNAIALAYVEDYTYRDVAALLKQPVDTIKSEIREGLAYLRVTLSSG